MRHRFVAEPCPPLDDEARSADGQVERAQRSAPRRWRRGSDVRRSSRARAPPATAPARFAEIFARGVGDNGEVDQSILVTERPALRVMANFHRENARVRVDCDAFAIGPSGATLDQQKSFERVGKPERGDFCAHVADLQHRRLAMGPADKAARLAAALDQPGAGELAQRLAHRHARTMVTRREFVLEGYLMAGRPFAG